MKYKNNYSNSKGNLKTKLSNSYIPTKGK